jgi:hypothetical protein
MGFLVFTALIFAVIAFEELPQIVSSSVLMVVIASLISVQTPGSFGTSGPTPWK